MKRYLLYPVIILFISALFTNPVSAQHWQKITDIEGYLLSLKVPYDNPDMLIETSNEYPVDFIDETPKFLTFGSGFRYSLDSGKTWSETKLDSFSVTNVIKSPSDPTVWFASVVRFNRGFILRSDDSGDTWDIENEYCEGSHIITDMAALSADGDDLYFAGAINTNKGFLKSENEFNDCNANETINVSVRDIKISSNDQSSIFLAGDKLADEGVFRSTDLGEEWIKDTSGLENLRINCVLPSGVFPHLIHCGADSITANREIIPKGIYRSIDTGHTWQLVAAEGYHIFELEEHPQNPDYVIAACGEGGVWMSANTGSYWKQYSDGLPQGSSVRQVAFPNWEPTSEGIRAYAGLYEGGIYLSQPMITSAGTNTAFDNNFMKIGRVYPQPFNNRINVEWTASKTGTYQFEIFDPLGRSIHSESEVLNAGDHNFSWMPENKISEGIYILKISSGNSSKFVKIIRRN